MKKVIALAIVLVSVFSKATEPTAEKVSPEADSIVMSHQQYKSAVISTISQIITSPLFANDLYANHYNSAESCSTIDYRTKYNYSARDQKRLSWCFAHASADNLQMLEGIRQQISAADIAIHYAKSSMSRFTNFVLDITGNKDPYSPPEFGWARIASNMVAKEGGYCLESWFPSDEWNKATTYFGPSKKVEISEAIKDVLKLHDVVKRAPQAFTNPRALPYYYSFHHLSKDDFYKIIVSSKNEKEVLDGLRVKACQYRTPFTANVKPRQFYNLGHLTKNLNQALEDGRPVSIDFASSVLKNLDKVGVNLGLHTVAVFGRRFDPITGQCQYLLKDSYGDKCRLMYDRRIKCEKGYLWVPQNPLIKSTTSIVTF